MSNIQVIDGVEYRNVGTHETHCCARHGCKYGDGSSCPVEANVVIQAYACEFCHSTAYLNEQIASLKSELEWSASLEARGLSIFGYNE